MDRNSLVQRDPLEEIISTGIRGTGGGAESDGDSGCISPAAALTFARDELQMPAASVPSDTPDFDAALCYVRRARGEARNAEGLVGDGEGVFYGLALHQLGEQAARGDGGGTAAGLEGDVFHSS